MKQKLVTMSGCKGTALGQPAKFQFSLFSMAGTADIMKIDPTELDDIDAGILTLYWIDKMYPGITWGDIIKATHKMGAKWYERIGQTIGNAISDTGDKLGDWGGDAIRLVTDKEVMEGVQYYGQTYATGGKNMALDGMIKNLGLENILQPDKLKALLSNLGSSTKTAYADAGGIISGVDNKYLMIGAAALIFVVLLSK